MTSSNHEAAIPSPVSKTATDALNAKASAIFVGYDPISKNHHGHVYKDLLQTMQQHTLIASHSKTFQKGSSSSSLSSSSKNKKHTVKRQSPLVNAGYAIRIAVLSNMIHEFISCHTEEMNIVLLGCGLDVLGLWAVHIAEAKAAKAAAVSEAARVNLYEIDCLEICEYKRTLLIESGMITPMDNDDIDDNGTKSNSKNSGDGGEKTNQNIEEEGINPCILQGWVNLNNNMYGINKDNNNSQNNEHEHEHATSTTPNYTLLHADLRSMSSLQNVFDTHTRTTTTTTTTTTSTKNFTTTANNSQPQPKFNNKLPTIVISELVLAYLGNEKVQQLLSFISEHLCIHENSMLIAYEPVVPLSSSLSTTQQQHKNSVIHGYAMNYFEQFTSKLYKGNATTTTISTNTNNQPLFQPIGNSHHDVIQLLRWNGFDGLVDCKSISQSIQAWNHNNNNDHDHDEKIQIQSFSPELFDEHAALRLHLQCYSVICATTKIMNTTMMSCGKSNNINVTSMFQRICPWSNIDDATLGMGRMFRKRINLTTSTTSAGATTSTSSTSISSSSSSSYNTDIILCSIQKEHQEQVRNLFSNTYIHLFDKYPSVKKMVKSAIKTDLSVKVNESLPVYGNDEDEERGHSNNDRGFEESAIWKHYSDRGGSFWVLIDQSGSSSSSSIDKVVGCLGITKRRLPDDSARENSSESRSRRSSYEINRLAVAPEARGMGFGKLLLETAEQFVRFKEKTTTTGTIELYATTPEILEAANSLYINCSFSKAEEKLVGNMVINTYIKKLQ